jgi:hypothetical protein
MQCVQALYPLFICPDSLLRAGQSLIVMNNNARRLMFSYRYSSHICKPSPCHNNNSSSTNGLRYTSISFPGCFGPGISIGIMMNFRFMQSYGGRLYIHKVTGQVLWLLLISPKGLMTSILKGILCSSHPVQRTRKFYLFFSTEIHQLGVSTLCLAFVLLCAIAST